MIQYKARHNDPSQQFNMKMAAFPNGCGHFPIYVTLRKWYNNGGRLLDWPHSRLTLGLQCGQFSYRSKGWLRSLMKSIWPAGFQLLYYYLSIFDIIQSKWPLLTYRGWPTPIFPIKSSLWQMGLKVVYLHSAFSYPLLSKYQLVLWNDEEGFFYFSRTDTYLKEICCIRLAKLIYCPRVLPI